MRTVGEARREKGYSRREDLVLWKGRRRVSRRTIIICTPVIFHVRRPWIMAVAVDANDLGLITTVCPPTRVSHCRWNDGGLFFSSLRCLLRLEVILRSRVVSSSFAYWSGSERKGNAFFCAFNYPEIRFILNDPLRPHFLLYIHEWFSSV